ncbi:glucosylceramidase [Bacillus coahuilensis m2-6]|uniref:Glucosylceramidase n=1 Tax=Bacillus coahuilensis p1.1.43 TaxID=1150625 RepID=A0A147KC20_9BACI|nr:glycoside hydrolase family 30 protein [Bacillus coahuilensis]KUP08975.1 glucosylceramidase [Bacillus coahuilensis p1.1.43]KUP09763.1 glucosylceramidase [Bacillus coahuilensis m2-6]
MKNVQVTLTAKDTENRLSKKASIPMVKDTESSVDIELSTDEMYQEIIGFGGAFTEAAAYTLDQMSEEKRQEALKSYFDQENGLGYTIGRVAIHSCDFALENYTYIEEGDKELSTFTIERDYKWVIPMIKDAMEIKGGDIELLASPWSPPAFMKTNNEMNHGGKLLPEYRDAWAMYYTKFVKAYQQEGLNVTAITVQNEPAAVQVWDSCIYTAEEERDFVKNHLGPIMEQEGLRDINIIIWDHNRDIVLERASTVLSDPEAAKYVWGTGIHWYVSEDFAQVGEVHNRFPDKHILFTEGCQEGGVKLGEWFTGERYARNMIGDLNNWVEGYLDWNLVLNEEGGPNHVQNLCDAPIIADTRTNELHYNSSYYYIGHFSKFIRPGAVRINVSNHNENLKTTAFLNKDGSVATVVLNETDETVPFKMRFKGELVETELPAHAIATYVI